MGALDGVRNLTGDVIQAGWERLSNFAAVHEKSRRARRFGMFGSETVICFPAAALFGERWIHLGRQIVIGPYVSLSGGVSPEHVPDNDPVLRIGDRCVIGRGSGILAHSSVEIGDDVWTGHHVYITDANHGYEQLDEVPGRQFADPRPVRVGRGAWLGHGTVVLPGADIGEHVVVGAGSVVVGAIPSYSVAVGNPARVIRRHVTGRGWVSEPGTGSDDAASG